MLVSGGIPSVELHLYDTYIVTDSLTVSIILSILLGIIGFLYWCMKDKKLIDWLTTIHLAATIFTFIFISSLFSQRFNDYQFSILAVAVVSQLIFVMNMVVSLIKNEGKN
jgi:O-antigen/teichoic acid export membrane protein